jgi:hypothetical protein
MPFRRADASKICMTVKGDTMKLRPLTKLVLLTVGGVAGLWSAWSYDRVMHGEVTVSLVFGFLLVHFMVSNAASHFADDHPKIHGAIQLLVGSVILVSYLDYGGASDSNHLNFERSILVSIFFFAEAIARFRSGRRLQPMQP